MLEEGRARKFARPWLDKASLFNYATPTFSINRKETGKFAPEVLPENSSTSFHREAVSRGRSGRQSNQRHMPDPGKRVRRDATKGLET